MITANKVNPADRYAPADFFGLNTKIWEIDMTAKLSYKIITTVGEESSKGNDAFEKIEHIVNEYIQKGWRPVGGIAVSSVVGPKTAGSTKDTWFVRVAQALVCESEEQKI
jgi:hypothetical protein